jgi:hypothetical protein
MPVQNLNFNFFRSETDDSVKAQVQKYILELNSEQSFKTDEILVLTPKNGPVYTNVESIRFADNVCINVCFLLII